MYKPLAVIGVAALLASGCAIQETAAASSIRIADAQMVKGCKFLGNVEGTSGWSGLAASTGQDSSMNQALNEAARLGATDVVWENVNSSWGSEAFGAAYKCP